MKRGRGVLGARPDFPALGARDGARARADPVRSELAWDLELPEKSDFLPPQRESGWQLTYNPVFKALGKRMAV